MTSTKQNQAVWHHNQTHRPRLVSPGDVTYMFASLFLSGMRTIPAQKRIQIINKASTFLARLLYTANVHSTRTIRANLNAVLGPVHSPDMIEADARRLLSMIAWNSLIINSLPAFSRLQIAELAQIQGIPRLDDCLASGHPVLIWSYHFGVHPIIVAAILHARGYPIHAIAHARQMPTAASSFQRFYLRRLSHISDQFPVIDPQEGLKRSMLDVLRNNECLYITPDYMVPEDERQPKSVFQVPIDFLGRKAHLQTGSLRLAKRLGAKVVTALSTQVNKDARRLIIEPFELPTSGFTPAESQQDLQMCMRRLEDQVLAHPGLWLDLKREDLLERLTPVSHPDCGGKQ